MRQSYSPYWRPDQLLGARFDTPDMTGELLGWEPVPDLVPDAHRVPIGSREPLRDDVVESETHPGTYYHLHLKGDGMWSCDCPGYQYRQECKHSRRKQEEKPW